MEITIVSRRFVRIKVIQALYMYAILQKVCKTDIIERIKKEFQFDLFLHDASNKAELIENRKMAIEIFCNEIESQTSSSIADYTQNSQVAHSVRNSLLYYQQTLLQNQKTLHTGFNQSKDYIYANYIYILLLLLEWYKLSNEMAATHSTNSLSDQLMKHPLLKELHTNPHWLNTINSQQLSWIEDQDSVKDWYTKLIHNTEVSPQNLLDVLPYANNKKNNVKILEFILQNILFKSEQVNDFFSMKDICWEDHKYIVAKMLSQTFVSLAAKDLSGFSLHWYDMERRWKKEAEFYNQLFEITIKNNSIYEDMICKKLEKWDSERIVLMDKLIMKLSLAEILEFEDIPVRVSINEYIEIAKLYGTDKNGHFVNGMLESICKERQIDI